MKGYLMPWKLLTFVIGMLWLFYGARAGIAPDWDYGISLIMGVWAYLTAPWAARVLIRGDVCAWPLAVVALYLGVDGLYVIYWSLMNPEALIIRSATPMPHRFSMPSQGSYGCTTDRQLTRPKAPPPQWGSPLISLRSSFFPPKAVMLLRSSSFKTRRVCSLDSRSYRESRQNAAWMPRGIAWQDAKSAVG